MAAFLLGLARMDASTRNPSAVAAFLLSTGLAAGCGPTEGSAPPARHSVSTPEPSCAQGQTRECYDGPPEAAGVGACKKGQQSCSATGEFTGTWGACVGWVAPIPEICGNGIDDNCNGLIDEGCTMPMTPMTMVTLTANFITGSDVHNNDCLDVSANAGPFASLGCSSHGSATTNMVTVSINPPPFCNDFDLKFRSNSEQYTTAFSPNIFAQRVHPELVTPSHVSFWLDDNDPSADPDWHDFHVDINSNGMGLFKIQGLAGGCM
jgi:hypothetical protein